MTAFDDPALQSLLESVAEREGFKSPKFEVNLGSKPGDNFCGCIYRTVISDADSKKKPLAVIVKTSPASKLRQQMLSTNQLFQTESEVYQLLLPEFNKLFKQHGLSSSDSFPGTPRYFGGQINGPNSNDCHVLVLEDKIADRFTLFGGKDKILDADHCKLAIQKLALWHAASMALHYHDPEKAETFAKRIRKDIIAYNNENSPFYDELITTSWDSLRKVQRHCKVEEAALKGIENLMENYRSELVRVNQPDPGVFCFIHGDFWINNMLFKYSEDGTVEDVCLIDLQIVRRSSPVVDLIHFLYCCTTKDVRDAHYEDLVRLYHDELASNLQKLDCDPQKIFSWECLQDQLKKYGRHGVLVALIVIPMMATESSDFKVDVHNSDEEGQIVVGAAVSKEKEATISRRIADVVEDGWRLGYF